MEFHRYQELSRKTAIYPDTHRIIYPVLGLVSEAGEVADKVKKVIRDKGAEFSVDDREAIRKKLGDVLWYVSQIASDLDFALDSVAMTNLEKLRIRQEQGKLHGSGDDR